MSEFTARLFYTLKMSHLTSLELQLRDMRSRLNELHTLEGTAPDPHHDDLERLDKAYIAFIASVQDLKSEVRPLAEGAGLNLP